MNRRTALRALAGVPLAGVAAPLGLSLMASAAQAAGGDYKALVCVLLQGGNDPFNTLLPTDADTWALYRAARATSGLALPEPGTPAASGGDFIDAQGGVLPIHPALAVGRPLALHPSLAPVARLFDDRRLSIVANVGALAEPVTKSRYAAKRAVLPAKLFSHNDQQSWVQSFGVEGARTGWGGRLADALMDANRRPDITAVTFTTGSPWANGESVLPYQLGGTGVIDIGRRDGRLGGSAAAHEALLRVVSGARSGHLIASDLAAVGARAVAVQAYLSGAMPAASAGPWGSAVAPGAPDPLLRLSDPVSGATETNPLAQQFQAVARMIAARGTLGMSRQVFFVALNGFDTHKAQDTRQATLLARLAHGLSYFDSTLRAMGVHRQVTTFTLGEFGRSFSANGDGTDHGWGTHQFVMGGAVRGARVVGRLPTYGSAIGATASGQNDFDSNDQIHNGVLLPSQSIDQYGATLARWFGAAESSLNDVFPHLARFDSGARDLGFMT
jgi:uncharacterized protein (DUF1501 family)